MAGCAFRDCFNRFATSLVGDDESGPFAISTVAVSPMEKADQYWIEIKTFQPRELLAATSTTPIVHVKPPSRRADLHRRHLASLKVPRPPENRPHSSLGYRSRLDFETDRTSMLDLAA